MSEINNFEAALQLAEMGICVCPIRRGSKGGDRGHYTSWKADRSNNGTKVLAWWNRWPDANIAACGGEESGIFIIDVDTYKLKTPGDATSGVRLDDLLEAAGVSESVEIATKMARTARGGTHYYFRWPEGGGIRCDNGIVPGIDIKGEGGYVIAPPSYVVDTEKGYEGYYTWLEDYPIAEAPPELITWLRENMNKPKHVAAPAPAIPAYVSDDTKVKRARACLAAMPPAISGSGGHTALFNAAEAVANGFDLDEHTAYSLLASEYNPRCQPLWSEQELRHKVTSAMHDSQRERGRLLNRTSPAYSPAPRATIPSAAWIELASSQGEPTPAGEARIKEATTKPKSDTKLKADDSDSSERLAAAYQGNFRFVDEWDKWAAFDGKRWIVNARFEVMRMAIEQAEYQEDVAEALPEFDRESAAMKKQALGLARHSKSLHGLNAAISISRSEPGVAIKAAELDQHDFLLPVNNGVIDLLTGELLPHSREYFFTKLCRVDYDPAATCPQWEAFLNASFEGNAELCSYIQRMVGYSISGSTKLQCLFFLFGGGSNGKGTFSNVIYHLLGTDGFACQMAKGILEERNTQSHSTEIASLKGKRFALCSETSKGKRWDEALVKSLTGSDVISARRMREDFSEFTPKFKIWISGNHKPVITGTDDGIWRRIRLIPFNAKIDESRIDRQLEEKLKAEHAGILAWAVRGYRDLLVNGERPPACVVEAIQSYRKEQDVLGQFVAECCALGSKDNHRVVSTKLRSAYEDWCKANGANPLSLREFNNQVSQLGAERATLRTGTITAKGWNGIRLLTGTDIEMLPV